jgi:hypothetical protein
MSSILLSGNTFGGGSGGGGTTNPNLPSAWRTVEVCEICIEIADVPTCGASCNFTISAAGDISPIGMDTTIVFSATATGDAGAGILTDVITTEYTDVQGNVVTTNGSISTQWGDLSYVSGLTNPGLITQLSVVSMSGNTATIRLYGDVMGMGAVELDLNNPPQPSFYSFINTNLDYFYPFWIGAVSNITNLGTEITFDYDLSVTSPIKEVQWWLNQCSFLLQEPTLQNAQLLSSLTFRYPLTDVKFKRTITYSNGCPTVTIYKRIVVDNATFPYANYHVETV